MPRPSNYSKGLRCERCGRRRCDYTRTTICRACHNDQFTDRTGVVISPWRVIEGGVLMRTVESRT
jgi:hypothetical protein